MSTEKLDLRTFDDFRELIYKKSGIKLNDSKRTLVCSRVAKRMRSLEISDYRRYLTHIIQDKSGQEIVHLLDAISTNVTYFFRESDHFQFLEETVRKLPRSGQKKLRIWSAGCSTGEEPYSIAMTVQEATGEMLEARILATDISTRALKKAQLGKYEMDILERVPRIYTQRYFDRTLESGAAYYTAKPRLRNMIVFRRLNLSAPPFPMRGPLDIVFCRNVMFYFSDRVCKSLLAEIHRLLKPHGHLIVGHAESLMGYTDIFERVQPAVYMKVV